MHCGGDGAQHELCQPQALVTRVWHADLHKNTNKKIINVLLKACFYYTLLFWYLIGIWAVEDQGHGIKLEIHFESVLQFACFLTLHHCRYHNRVPYNDIKNKKRQKMSVLTCKLTDVLVILKQ